MSKKNQKDTKEHIIEKALHLAEQMGWAQTTLHDIARECTLTLPELFDYIEDKNDILVLLGRTIDRRTLEGVGEPDPETTPRDQLFDILMDRFEILNDYRGGITAILESFKYDPKQAVITCPHLARSMTWMLEAANIETTGLRGAIKVTGLTALYLKTLKIWHNDDSPDLGKVMAALDKDLGRVESVANTLGF